MPYYIYSETKICDKLIILKDSKIIHLKIKQASYILWLPSWYPNRNDSFDGDFIQRHAKAAAIHNEIHVVFATEMEMQKEYEEEWNYMAGLTEQIVYFKKLKGPFKKARKQILWSKFLLGSIERHFQQYGKPHSVHVHVPWKAGIAALFIKRKYKLKFIITEHWGIYNDVVEDNFATQPFYLRFALKKIFAQAEVFLSVSKDLVSKVDALLLFKKAQVIPNAVDTSLFFQGKEKHSKFTFLHVSNMVPLKDVKGIIQAFYMLVNKKGATDVQLIMVGNRGETHKKIARDYGLLGGSVFFKGEVPYEEVAEEMRKAHCFVLNSHIENSPCVIGEALCCGLPVISTNVGGVPEMVDSTNGILIPAKDPMALVTAMERMIVEYHTYDHKGMSTKASERYNYLSVSQMFVETYNSLK